MIYDFITNEKEQPNFDFNLYTAISVSLIFYMFASPSNFEEMGTGYWIFTVFIISGNCLLWAVYIYRKVLDRFETK